MADATRTLARTFMQDELNVSPQHKAHAIALLQEDAQLSLTSLTKAFMLVRQNTSIADIFSTIKDSDTRTSYIMAELDASSV